MNLQYYHVIDDKMGPVVADKEIFVAKQCLQSHILTILRKQKWYDWFNICIRVIIEY